MVLGAPETIKRFEPSALIEFNSFTMIGFKDINPRDLLRHIRKTWPFVYKIAAEGPRIIATDSEELNFIHDNLVTEGCVDDLYCSFTAC
jgi:hypothetical protein